MRKLNTVFVALFVIVGQIFADGNTPLCFTAKSSGATVTLNLRSGFNPGIQTSRTNNGTDWINYTSGNVITLTNVGDKVYFRSANNHNQSFGSTYYNFSTFVISDTIEASGNIMSLYGPNCPNISLPQYAFIGLFKNCSTLVSAPQLPATTLGDYSYCQMFYGCSSLTTAPQILATSLASDCCNQMFYGCTSLTTAPELQATTLGNFCYVEMFYGCTSLTTAPQQLPATSLSWYCYQEMFSGCTSLTTAPVLPAVTLTDHCYEQMFKGCTSLTSAPQLPATTLANYCYSEMFNGCTSLMTAPQLSATTLVRYCYSQMFKGCTSLTTAPQLPATTLANYCYFDMFNGCTSLTTGPQLPATNLVNYCYSEMFKGCTSLTTAPQLSATALASYCYSGMFSGCSSLTATPELPATTLAQYCYSEMFYGCSSLTKVPLLPAVTLNYGCYNSMFYNCSSIVINNEGPGKEWIIPATATASDALTNMLSNTGGTMNGTPECNKVYYRTSGLTSVVCYINDSTMGKVTGAGYYEDGEVVTLTAKANGHCHFVNWSNGDTASSITITVNGDTSFTANFAIDQYNIAVTVNDTAMGSVVGSGTYNYGTIATLIAKPKEHCHFVSWNNGNTADTVTVSVYADQIFHATFAKDQHTITANSNDESMGGVIGGGTYDYGHSVTLAAIANENYHFVSWSNGKTTSVITVPLYGDSTLTATFAAGTSTVNIYNIVFADYDNSILRTDSVIYGGLPSYLGTTPVKPATAQYIYTFAGWYPALRSVIGDAVYTAQYDSVLREYNVVFRNYDGALLQNGNVNYGVTPSYTGITPIRPSTAQYDYTFKGWNPAIGSVNGDAVYTADYDSVARSYTVSVNHDATEGSVTGAGTYNYGHTATLVATPNAHYHFVRWSNGMTTDSISVLVNRDMTLSATFALNYYNVSFVNYEGTQLRSDSVVYGGLPVYLGETPGKPTTAQYIYTFKGWNPDLSAVNGDVVYTAQYDSVLREYNVVFRNYDGALLQNGNVNYGVTPSYTGITPIRPSTAQYDYTFKGWNPVISAVNGDAVYTADYDSVARSYTVSVNHDATEGSVTGAGTYNYGQTAVLVATPNAHYHFVRWSNGMTTDSISVLVNGDMTLSATFAKDQHTITANSNDESMGGVIGGGMYDYGQNAVLAAIANENYHFVSWSNGATSAVITVPVYGDSTITATFAIDQFTVAVNVNDATMGSVSGGGEYAYGQTAILTATASDHYHFVKWSNGKTATTISVPVFGDSIFVAIFAIDQYTVTVSSIDETMGSVIGGGMYDYGQNATLAAISSPHYHFVSWSNGETTHTITITVNGDTTLTATFDIDQHTVTVNSNDSTMGDVSGGGTFDYGQTVTITATANEHYHFVSWSNGLTSPTITITVSNNTTLTATFEADVYNVTATANYASRGIVTGSGQYSYLDRATLTAMPNQGYIFTGWSNGETNQTIHIMVECDTAITAIFEEGATAVDDVEKNHNIIIAPNPVKVGETICIKGDFTDDEMNRMLVEILSTDGTLVNRTSISTTPIELDGINSVGTYIVRITTGTGKVYVEKLMVK